MTGTATSQASAVHPPKRWKGILVTFAVVYPLVMIMTNLLAPALTSVPEPLRSVALVLGMCTVLSFALPWAQAKAEGWVRR